MAEVFWHNLEVGEVEKVLRTDVKSGLSQNEVKIRQKEFGRNKLPEEEPLKKWGIFYSQFRSPLIYILLFSGIITVVLRDFTDAVVIFGVVFLNAVFGFFQENKTSETLNALKKIVRHSATVLREGYFKIVDSEELVPGDIIILNPGDRVPADGRIVKSGSIKINEMALTGEWLAEEKSLPVLPQEKPLADRNNMVYMGSVVEDGRARAIVTETGFRTEIGKVAVMVKGAKEEKTPYQKKITDFSRLIVVFIIFISFLILILGLATGKEFVEMFTLAVAVAVAAIPEGLPIAITVILALGMQRILRRKGLVRKLVSAETLGSTSIIVTDKTGTLTEGKMRVDKIVAKGNDPKNEFLSLKIAILTSEAFIENPDELKEKWIIRGRPTEKALLEAGIQLGINGKREPEKKQLVRLPFNPINKFAAAIYEEDEKSEALNQVGSRGPAKFLYACGAPEKILELCTFTNDEKKDLNKKLDELAKKGLRIVATAIKTLREPTPVNLTEVGPLLADLNFVGFITLKDPIRPEVKEAIKICRQAGMTPIIVTGDHKLTVKAVAEEIGLKIREQDILEGKEIDKLSDKELEKILPQIKIYARVEPRHKLRIIEVFQRRGDVVAMTGDGINDAPALKRADIGVALGSGTEVAKESSDLILLNDSFSIIVGAVEEGRAIIDNIRKLLTYLFSYSFTEVILITGSMFVAWLTNTAWLLPVLATQILWVNFIEDGPLSLALAFEAKEKDLMLQKQKSRETSLFTKEMKVFIFIIGIITDFLLLGLFFGLLKYSGYEISHIRSVVFAGLGVGSTFSVFSCKSLRKNLWQIDLFSNKFLVISWVFAIMMLFSAFYFPPLQTLLRTVPLNLFDWQLILILGFLNMLLIEAAKWYFITKSKPKN